MADIYQFHLFILTFSAVDYSAPAALTATFSAGSSDGATACVSIAITDDEVLEGSETMTAQLVSVNDSSGMGNVVNLGALTTATITILDNEGKLSL